MDLTKVIVASGYIANIMQCDRKLITSCGCKIALELFFSNLTISRHNTRLLLVLRHCANTC